MIDEDGAALDACESAVGADRHLAQVVVVADAGEDDLLAFGGLLRRARDRAAVLGRPLFRLGGGAVVDGDVVALALEMAGHRIAHDPEPQERHLRHRTTLPFKPILRF